MELERVVKKKSRSIHYGARERRDEDLVLGFYTGFSCRAKRGPEEWGDRKSGEWKRVCKGVQKGGQGE